VSLHLLQLMKVIILSLPVGSFCRIAVAYPADRHSHGGVEGTSDRQTDRRSKHSELRGSTNVICILIFTFSKLRNSVVA